jgi:hypothetical protein
MQECLIPELAVIVCCTLQGIMPKHTPFVEITMSIFDKIFGRCYTFSIGTLIESKEDIMEYITIL